MVSELPYDERPHGGRLHAARRRFPGAPEPFLDLSTGINPHAYPFTPPPQSAWQRLPEPEDVLALQAAAARAYGVRDPAMIVAAPGTQALIQLLPRVLPQPHIAIPGPTYAEHAAAWGTAGTEVLSDLTTCSAATLCNPNNPDGTRHGLDAVASLADRLALLVVDEAFADFEPGPGAATLLPRPGLVVLRSFGKAYGLAGLRLGFALAEPGLAARLRNALGPWAVSGPAITIGTEALSDTGWRTAAATTAHAAAARLDGLLERAGFGIKGGTTLFRLAAGPDAAQVAERLGRAGILVRSFDHTPTALRFGLPGDEAAWSRLASALSAGRTKGD